MQIITLLKIFLNTNSHLPYLITISCFSLKFLLQSNRRWLVFWCTCYPYARVFPLHNYLQLWDRENRIAGWFLNRVVGLGRVVFGRGVESRFAVPIPASVEVSGAVCYRVVTPNRKLAAWSGSISGFGFCRWRQRRCGNTRAGSWCCRSILWRLCNSCQTSLSICVLQFFGGCRCRSSRGQPH